MEVSQYLYAVLVGVVLFAVGAIWIVARMRGGVGALRIEPGLAPHENPAPKTDMPVNKAPPAGPTFMPVPEADAAAVIAAEVPAGGKIPERPLEQGYKGFKIQLREKQPGLWVASIADARNRRKADASHTHEYYQMPAALAEAKVIIDRRLASRR